MFRGSTWMTVALFAAIVCLGMGQRGGGGRSSGGGSRSSGRSWSSGSRMYITRSVGFGSVSSPVFFTSLALGLGACLACSFCRSFNRRKMFLNKEKLRRNAAASIGGMSLSQFELERKKFMEREWKFTYLQEGIQQETPVESIRMTQETPYVYRMNMQGSDSLGDWSAEGYYLLTPSGVQFWMIKDYRDKERAGQTGEWEFLLYEGRQDAYKNYAGRWYYDGFEDNPSYSGDWRIMRTQNLMTRPEPYYG